MFAVPQDVKAVSLFFFLSNNGWVNRRLPCNTVQFVVFNRGLVTLTFDDGFEENITTALPVLDQYGFKATHCFATQYVEGIQPPKRKCSKLPTMGPEFCSHTVTTRGSPKIQLPR